MASFRTNFYSLLSEKEEREEKRYNSTTEISKAMGISRVTFYKYVDEELTSVDSNVINSFLEFLGVPQEDLGRFLVIGDSPQSNAQEVATVSAMATEA